MFDEKFEMTQLPTKSEFKEIFNHLKEASLKSW